MPQYVIVYLGGAQPSSPEEGKRHFAKYMEWLSSLGDSAVSPANPLIASPSAATERRQRASTVQLNPFVVLSPAPDYSA